MMVVMPMMGVRFFRFFMVVFMSMIAVIVIMAMIVMAVVMGTVVMVGVHGLGIRLLKTETPSLRNFAERVFLVSLISTGV